MPQEAQESQLPKNNFWTRLIYAALAVVLVGVVGAGAFFVYSQSLKRGDLPVLGAQEIMPSLGPSRVPFEETSVTIAPAVSQDFSIAEIRNISDMEKTYGVSFTASDLDRLEKNKFLVKNLLDTNLTPVEVGENSREFVSLYEKVSGSQDVKERTQANAVFISADVLMNLFSVLSVDLLKETENKYLYAQVLDMTKGMYEGASSRIGSAKTDEERAQWVKVRNYFSVPYALLSTVEKPVTAEEYWQSDRSESVEEMQAQYKKKDASADSFEKTAAFVKSLTLDAESERVVIADIKTIYDAPDKALPKIFESEYESIAGDIQFQIPFSLFTVRGSYTSSSLRRQYFRAVQWYQQIPFFSRSPELSAYALDIGTLLQSRPDLLNQYNSLSSLLAALVGNSDDLDASDYAAAVNALDEDITDSQKLKNFLAARKPDAKIKSMPAFYPSVGSVSVEEVMEATRGMRFFSQKFIPDSYWTGRLTQGDEKPAVKGMQLPRTASSLEVMTILGSTYAQAALPMLPFYPEYRAAIDARLLELINEAAEWGGEYWQSNQVTSILWSISGLYEWLEKHRASAPRFMQSKYWDAKTLMTGSAFWTELRHTNILYAKQSFAEKGGGGEDQCDTRKIPPPAQGYLEPQPASYDRLYYASRLLSEEYKMRGFELKNLKNLNEYVRLMNIAREYAKMQLENAEYNEPIVTKKVSASDTADCLQEYISPEVSIKRGTFTDVNNADGEWVSALSRPEELRRGIVGLMRSILPQPVEGPILPIKDKRAALVADVHTSDEGIVEEGTGVPRVIFVAVKDANGPRLTIGFTYSHYEFLSSERLTDEQWQKRFYTDEGGDYQITYKPKTDWPSVPAWYESLLGKK